MYTSLLFLYILSFFVGMASGVLGIGGGSFLVPIMTELFGIEAHVAIATSLFTIVFTSLSSLYGHHRINGIEWGISKRLMVTTIPMAIAGSYTTEYLSSVYLRDIFGAILLLGALLVYVSMKYSKEKEDESRMWVVFVIGSIGGFLSGLLGIGGAIVMVPLLMLSGFDAKMSVSSTVPAVFISSIFSTTVHAALGHVDILLVAIIVLATIPGAQIGVKIFGKMTSIGVKYVYIILLIFTGIKMILS